MADPGKAAARRGGKGDCGGGKAAGAPGTGGQEGERRPQPVLPGHEGAAHAISKRFGKGIAGGLWGGPFAARAGCSRRVLG